MDAAIRAIHIVTERYGLAAVGLYTTIRRRVRGEQGDWQMNGRGLWRGVATAGLFLALMAPALADSPVHVTHAIAMNGEPKYGPDFKHLDYVNPDAPKGGTVRFAALGTFDNFNPFILKGAGSTAAGAGAPFETLLVGTDDEAFSAYGLIAESIEMPEDRSWVAFTLRPEARWHDGTPITVEDVIFSLDVLKTHGHPFYRAYYANVEKAEKVGDRKVKFTFKGGTNRELPLIIGQLPILPKAYWQGKDFEATTMTPPMGSGPYKVASFESGRSVTLQRVPDYWGKDLPINVGHNNFDTIRYEYYRDGNVEIEAVKAGDYDFRQENISKVWATAYDTPAVRDGRLIKEEIPNQVPSGMQGFAFNIRRDIFKDPKVREALTYALDFEWTNKALFYGLYARTRSYFDNSELAATGLPGPEELKILEPYRGKIPDEVFTKEYQPPKTDGSGNMRANLRAAAELLKAAGWEVRNGTLVNGKTGEPLAFEILLNDTTFERVTLPFVQNLQRLGVKASVRTVDPSQYEKRLDHFDFDMTIVVFSQSLSPGNEQRDFWSSASADTPGGKNLVGIKDPAVDALADLIIAAPDRDQLIYRTRALDRLLQWGFYVVPNWHSDKFRVIYWNKLAHPAKTPPYGLPTDTWWIDPTKAAALQGKQSAQ
jgi:microcin C transport system substrate-binding protein